MPQRDANEIAALLEEIGRRAVFDAGNPYSAKAYVRAAASLRRLSQPLNELIREGALQSIPGVGAAIAKRFATLHSDASDDALERMRRKLPAGLLELLAIPGLKPQTIMKLHTLLGVNTLEELVAPAAERKSPIRSDSGPRSSARSCKASPLPAKGGSASHEPGTAVVDQTIAELKRPRPVLRKITIAGDMRRACELVSDLRLVAVDPRASKVKEEHFGV